MIKKLIFALMCGIIGTVFVAQYDPWVHEKMGDILKATYARAFHCTVNGHVESVDFLHPQIILSNFSLTSSDDKGTWSWKAQKYYTGFSWPFFLRYRTVDMWVAAKNLTATTSMYEGIPAITPHVKALMSVPDLPIKVLLKSTKIQNASLAILDEKNYALFCWDSNSQRTKERLSSQIQFKQGTLIHHGQTVANSLRGTLNTEQQTKTKEGTLSFNGQIDLPQLGTYPTCFVSGTWHTDHGRFHIQSTDKSLRINPLILKQSEGALHVNGSVIFPLAYCIKLLTLQDTSAITGSCTMNIQGNMSSTGQCEGYFACEDLRIPWLPDPSIITCSFKKQQSDLTGSINLRTGSHSSWYGLFGWQENHGNGSCHLYNNLTHPIPCTTHWLINPHDASIEITYDKPTEHLALQYQAQTINTLTHKSFIAKGTIDSHAQQHIQSSGTWGNYHHTFDATTHYPFFKQITLHDNEGTMAAHIVYDAPKDRHTTHLAIPFIRTICQKIFDQEIHGEGTIHIESCIKKNKLHAELTLNDATIRLPQTYNFINGCKASLKADLTNTRLTARNIQCTLHSGSLFCPRVTVWLTPDRKLQFAHIPIIIDHCLFTIKQDLFTMISGYLLFDKQPEKPACLQGHLILDRSQLKENLLWQQEQKRLFHTASSLQEIPEIPLSCNITIETKEPIRIDTPFLQANAELTIHASGAIVKPRVSGTIRIPSGTISFPYKPLEIAKGEITFFEDQLFNPAVELIAKNRIKNHFITLHVAGSAQNHAILLEASPPLTDEQIVNMLLTGAHENSLTSVIPALLMQNVSNMLFSSHKSDFFDNYIKPFMKKVNVQLKPEFNDQTGRGGLRGALEITVNERWRALIEKNFSLTEDTRFELEYMVSDEVTFRITRDERRDVGGEVEMKWKF